MFGADHGVRIDRPHCRAGLLAVCGVSPIRSSPRAHEVGVTFLAQPLELSLELGDLRIERVTHGTLRRNVFVSARFTECPRRRTKLPRRARSWWLAVACRSSP